jgi:hypothetical protein
VNTNKGLRMLCPQPLFFRQILRGYFIYKALIFNDLVKNTEGVANPSVFLKFKRDLKKKSKSLNFITIFLFNIA